MRRYPANDLANLSGHFEAWRGGARFQFIAGEHCLEESGVIPRGGSRGGVSNPTVFCVARLLQHGKYVSGRDTRGRHFRNGQQRRQTHLGVEIVQKPVVEHGLQRGFIARQDH